MTLISLVPALLIHVFSYSKNMLAYQVEKQTKRPAPGKASLDASAISSIVRQMQAQGLKLETAACVCAAFASPPVCMWIGVRLMDAGFLQSLWPWPSISGSVLLGLLLANSNRLRQTRINQLIDGEMQGQR